MSLFKKDQSVEESQEFSGYSVLSSGVYKGIIKQAFLTFDKGQNGTNINMNWKLDVDVNGSNQERTFSRIFIAKLVNGQAVYFSEKDGKRTEYPAFGALRRHLDTLISKSLFDDGVLTEKMLPVYNFQTKKDEPTSVHSLDDLVGLEAAFGIMENHENGYKDPSKVVKSNSIERVWKLVDGQPFNAEEIRAGLTEPQNCVSWKESWAGKVNDRNLDKNKLNGGTSSKGTQALDIG